MFTFRPFDATRTVTVPISAFYYYYYYY